MGRENSRRGALSAGALLSLAALGVALRLGDAATTYLYVDGGNPNCSDGGSGTSSQPFCTIGAAASKVAAGQTVAVSPGTYTENVTVPRSGTSSAPIRFLGVDGDEVIVEGGTHGFTLSGRSYVRIENFTVRETTSDGIYVTGGGHLTITKNKVRYCGKPVSGQIGKGIRLSGTTDSTISRNVVDHNTDTGVFLTGGAARNTVTRNESYENARVYTRAAVGIEIYDSDSNVVSFNVAHDNEDTGVGLRAGSTGNLVVGNVTYANGDHGIDLSNAPQSRVVSNSVYGNATSGINVEGAATGTSLANNVSVDNGIGSTRSRGNIRVDSTAISGTTLDYDLVDLSVSGDVMVWGSNAYGSLSSFRSATGQEKHGIEADPRWEAPDSGDLRPMAGSPAIDSADSGADGETTTDADGNPRVDDPATPNSGAGPRPYDDRGAYEFQSSTTAPTPTPTPQSSSPTPTPTPTPTSGGTNLVGNPGFETETTGWSASGSGVTLARVSGGHSGSYAARLSNDGGSSTSCALNDSPNWVGTTASGTYTGRLWARADTAGAVLKLRFREYAGSTLVGATTAQATLGTSWQQVSVVHAPVSPGSTLDLNAYVSSAPSGVCFYADDASIVRQ